MQAGTARLLACTLTDAVSIINSEVWSSSCPENQYHDIEVALNVIYRRLLGVEAKTASVAVWHELGVASVATRINAAALKFRNNILSLDPRDFLVRRVYDGLLNESKGRGSSRNGALFLEDLALEANWPGPLKKLAAKKFVNEFVASRRVSELADGFKRMTTLRNMSDWVEKERFGLPEYLLRTCPSSLREGRRLKTKFRLGCHDLRSSSSRMHP